MLILIVPLSYSYEYLTDGMVSKIELSPGTHTGIEMSYPGMWPHGAGFSAKKGACHAICTSSRSPWRMRYDMNYKYANSTMTMYPSNQNGVEPNFDKVLGINPWIDFSEYVEGGDVIPTILEK